MCKTAQAVEARFGQTRARLRGQHDARGIADDDVFDVAFAINQHADLPFDFVRNLSHLPRQFLRRNFRWWHAARSEFFESFELTRF
ncbi:MAG: hypothetical protein U0Y68_03125 [Blastocatellia bacterium]